MRLILMMKFEEENQIRCPLVSRRAPRNQKAFYYKVIFCAAVLGTQQDDWELGRPESVQPGSEAPPGRCSAPRPRGPRPPSLSPTQALSAVRLRRTCSLRRRSPGPTTPTAAITSFLSTPRPSAPGQEATACGPAPARAQLRGPPPPSEGPSRLGLSPRDPLTSPPRPGILEVPARPPPRRSRRQVWGARPPSPGFSKK
ncbi:basic proline-rich protein-like [Vulpes lagopus]|uniref:basic proline-rich protein-like n=1 Tax=Vulpes lagopus TaxID=494514 RepID=UPI001BC93FA2|nr:basic proline-rich protein-like [Vulpes lagopus]